MMMMMIQRFNTTPAISNVKIEVKNKQIFKDPVSDQIRLHFLGRPRKLGHKISTTLFSIQHIYL